MSTAATIANEPKFIAVTAIDDLKNHTRLLVFENHSTFPGTIEIVPFPEQCSSIFYNGTVYDWYGRAAPLDSHIQRIVATSGQIAEPTKNGYIYRDRFIAKLYSGKYAFVDLKYHTSYLNRIKHGVIDDIAGCLPYLEFKKENIIHSQEILDYIEESDPY